MMRTVIRMLDERTKKMIRGYLPHRRDPELKRDEYYWRDYNNKVQKVFITSIFPYDNGTEYGLRYASTGNCVHTYDEPFHGVYMSQLYDNRQDCKDWTHVCYDEWEKLRRIADREGWDEYED